MATAPVEVWYRLHDTPDQLSALVEAWSAFATPSDFAAAFWSPSEGDINQAHEVEAGFTTVQNYAAEVARWAAIQGGWRAISAGGYIPFSARKDYEALRDNAVISHSRFSDLWSLQIERNHLTHERPDVDPRKVWVASHRVARVVPAFFLDVQAWAAASGITI
jgi:hypothetical protein